MTQPSLENLLKSLPESARDWYQGNTETSGREIVTTRNFDAPRDLVYKVWTDPRHVGIWWGPQGFTNTIHEMDVRVGGQWRLTMHGPDGTDYPNRMIYLEVIAPERLVFLHGDDSMEGAFYVTVTFKALGNRTELTMKMVFKTTEQRNDVVEKYGALEGNRQTMDRLAGYLETLI